MHNAPLEVHEQTEHVTEHHGEHHDPLVSRIAILIAFLAVFTAVSSNLETMEGEKALAASTEATLQQDMATDAWGEYQADSLKRHLYTISAAAYPALAEQYSKIAKEQRTTQDEVRLRAEAAETERSRLLAESREHENRNIWLRVSATLFEIAIALGTVSIVTRRQWLTAGSALLGAVGLVLLAVPYV